MAGRVSPSEPADLLAKIRGFVRLVLEDLCNGRPPSVALDRFKTYCSDPSGNCSCSTDLPCGKDIVSLESKSHAYRIDIMLRLLLIIQQLLQENKHASKRDIYYMEPSVFQDQGNVDRAINDICILLECSRHHLNVVPMGKGLVMGWLRFIEAGRKVNCIKNPNDGFPVPICIEETKDIVSVAQYILVVEKETVFQRLANDKFCERNRCIVITGRGYPDAPTRRNGLTFLVNPVYADPYGFDILTTYRFGSMQMAYDAKIFRVPGIYWLGVFLSDSEKYCLPNRCLLNLTAKDKQKAEAILMRCYLHREAPKWRLELEIMLDKGVKYEIEALSASSLSFLSTYIPQQIQGRHYI
ncbi:hypothetical protein J5N97_008391 [Dioscorea zingiberensis]|uniref:DNA topoisomerase (ATP-hydrolyzing) n=1 Tax=Dioscorea zingiberensis TaxID=325984 RepID=A0A9D5CUS1_9LILI|nr:hypothetical protein J5N97_008391 [Dioscorea zingiberensis]